MRALTNWFAFKVSHATFGVFDALKDKEGSWVGAFTSSDIRTGTFRWAGTSSRSVRHSPRRICSTSPRDPRAHRSVASAVFCPSAPKKGREKGITDSVDGHTCWSWVSSCIEGAVRTHVWKIYRPETSDDRRKWTISFFSQLVIEEATGRAMHDLVRSW